jgi:rhodanese-related sulfurtransferase
MSESRSDRVVVQVSPTELGRQLEAYARLALLDVREDDERAICRIAPPEGVVDLHVPMGEIPVRLDEIEDAVGGLPVVVYCHHGIRSLMISKWLAARGFRCGNLTGGIDAWAQEIDPLVARY